MALVIGLLIPLLGTMLGAAFVFLMKDEMSPRLQKSLSSNKGLEAFYALREEARKNGLQDMTLDEINKEIRLAREEREAME